MLAGRQSLRQNLADYGVIISRHVITIVSFIFAALIVALATLGERQDALFLASVLTLNILIGIMQEIRAKRALDKLRNHIQPMANVVLLGGSVDRRPVEALRVGDTVRLQRGDQVPGDGHVVKVAGFEVNEAFLTGESMPIGKRLREEVFAGSFVTSGTADIIIDALGEDTRLGRVEDKVTRLRWRTTEIQSVIGLTITVMSWALIGIAFALTSRQAFQGVLDASLLRQVAALAATIVPEGLLLASTVFFAYGAVRLFRWRVLMQQINAVETLGRVQILCLDKTGTLTEDRLSLVGYVVAPGATKSKLRQAFGHYLSLTDPESEMAIAYCEQHKSLPTSEGEVTIDFSSERKYGQVRLDEGLIWVGAPDQLLDKAQRQTIAWIKQTNEESASLGERVVLVATQATAKSRLRPLGVVRFAQPIKQSAPKALEYFRRRGVRLVVISGDQSVTVSAIASQLGWLRDATVITGEMWAAARKDERQRMIADCTLFARVTPQQKEQLVRSMKKLGITAMTGDGANDALAIRRADLRISMLAGADITRTVADVVLVDNEFHDMPGGVKIADEVITTLELVAVLFFSKILLGLTLVGWAFTTATTYALSPRQITLLNYFLIGLPVLIWAVWPVARRRSPFESSFWSHVVPYVGLNGLALLLGLSLAYNLALRYVADVSLTIFLVAFVGGLMTFLLSSWSMRAQSRLDWRKQVMLVGLAIALLGIAVIFPQVRIFFDLAPNSLTWLWIGVSSAVFLIMAQIMAAIIARSWYERQSRLQHAQPLQSKAS